MPGVALTDGVLEVSNTDSGDQLVGRLQLLGEEFGADVEGWQVERVREALKTQRYFHAVHYPKAFHLHALNYARGLARLAEQAGVRIFEETPVVSIDPAGVRKRIVTPAARMRADFDRACRQRASRRAVSAAGAHAAAGLALRRGDRTAGRTARRCDRSIAAPSARAPASTTIASSTATGCCGPGPSPPGTSPRAASHPASSGTSAAVFPAARQREGRRRLERRDRRDRARHAADRPAAPRSLGRQRLWPAGARRPRRWRRI